MTELIRPIVNLRPNTVLEFRLSSKQTVISKFQKLTLDGIEYREDEALEYLEIKSNQQATPIEFIKQGQSVSLQLGQYLTTVDKLTTTFNWTQKKVRYWLAKWQKQGIVSCQVVQNKLGHKIGTLITLHKFQEFRNQLGIQFKNYTENQKKLSQNWGSRFCSNNQEKQVFGANKLIKENTYKNNIENHNPNSLIFEANKKLYQVNSKILEEKRKQGEELLILRNALKKEKTRNNQLKSLKRFEVSGEIKTDKIKYNWDFQDTAEFKEICEKLTSFGFERFAINKLWWNNSTNIQKLLDFIDYTQMKFDQGKVKDKKRFLYHAMQANYDLGELEKVRREAKSKEERDWIEDKKRAEELKSRQIELNQQEQQKAKQQEEFKLVRTWIKNNRQDPLFDQVLGQLEQENQFMITRLSLNARKHGFRTAFEFIRSEKISEMDLGLSGILSAVMAIS